MGSRAQQGFSMELAGLEPGTSWVRSVGARGLRGTRGDG